ncbi:MAM and LDL-receptor class A domain-containing protein 1-like [Lineus longissimus]|uniref:MAM and LDL-receptor class A domain-containing protein 1-like n=1 Tax=Lineus longissimus TaxID=88925 RepID=UPI00315CEB81
MLMLTRFLGQLDFVIDVEGQGDTTAAEYDDDQGKKNKMGSTRKAAEELGESSIYFNWFYNTNETKILKFKVTSSHATSRSHQVLKPRLKYFNIKITSSHPISRPRQVFLPRLMYPSFKSRQALMLKQVRLNTQRPTCEYLNIRLNIVDFVSQWKGHPQVEIVTVLMSDTSGIIRGNGIVLHSSRHFRQQFRPEIILEIPEPCESHDHFQCSTGECKPGNVRCNFQVDCPTGNDELDCGYQCDFNNRTTCGWIIEKLTPNITGLILANGSNADKAPNDYIVMFKSENMRPGDRARLTSKWFSNTQKNAECKLRYYFYMNGSRPGELDVKVYTLSGRQISLMKFHDNYLNRWHEQFAEIGDIAEPFRIFFIFTREGDRGTIGLDDIEIRCRGQYKIKETPLQGHCPKMSFPCSTSLCKNLDQVCDFEDDCLYGDDENNCEALVPKEGKCTFEDGLCGWTSNADEGYIWQRVKAGSTRDVKDSPSSQHMTPSMSKLEHFARLANFGGGRDNSRADYEKNSPKSEDHTFKNSSGHYIMMTKNPKKSRSSLSSTSYFESPLFPAPPPENYCNHTSPYFQLCKVRLFLASRHPLTSLYMEFKQLNATKKDRDIIPKSVKATNDETFVRNKWIRKIVIVPDKITLPYRIILRGYYFNTNYDKLVVDDISLTPECFGKGKFAEINSTDSICKGLAPKPTGKIYLQ